MHRAAAFPVISLLMLAGCGGTGSNPPQPKLSDDQVKDIMKNAKDQTNREGADRPMVE